MKNILKLLFLIAVFISFQACSKNQNTTGSKTDSAGNNTSSTTNSSNGSSSGSPSDMMAKGFEIDYKITGMMNGSGVIAVKNKKSRTEMTYDMQGQKVGMKAFNDAEWIYTMMDMGDMKQNTKMKIKDKAKKDPSELDYANLKKELEKFKKVGTETIIGKECVIYEVAPGATISVYNDMVPLKVKTEGMTMEATAVDFDSGISDSEMTPPADVTFKEVNY